MIPAQNIVAWGSIVPWADQRQVEQDLIISRALIDIFNDDLLSAELRFRGGTALNKLHFPEPLRYSDRDGLLVDRHVEIGLVERERFDQVGMLRENFSDLRRDSTVDVETRRHEYEVGATPFCGDRGQRRSHTESTGLVACGGHDAARGRAADGDRLAPQLRIVALLDRCEKRIHIDMNDLAAGSAFLRIAIIIMRSVFIPCDHPSVRQAA